MPAVGAAEIIGASTASDTAPAPIEVSTTPTKERMPASKPKATTSKSEAASQSERKAEIKSANKVSESPTNTNSKPSATTSTVPDTQATVPQIKPLRNDDGLDLDQGENPIAANEGDGPQFASVEISRFIENHFVMVCLFGLGAIVVIYYGISRRKRYDDSSFL